MPRCPLLVRFEGLSRRVGNLGLTSDNDPKRTKHSIANFFVNRRITCSQMSAAQETIDLALRAYEEISRAYSAADEIDKDPDATRQVPPVEIADIVPSSLRDIVG